MVSRFPDGPFGLGLLLLRSSVAAMLLATDAPLPLATVAELALVVISAAIAIGLRTRIASACSLLPICAVVFASEPVLAAALVTNAIAVILLGPGALSLDARIYGRRKLRLPDLDDTIV